MASVVDAKAPVVLKSKRSNVLNKYRSISYVFTLSALRKSALDNPDAIEVLIACNANIQKLRNDLSVFLDENSTKIVCF